MVITTAFIVGEEMAAELHARGTNDLSIYANSKNTDKNIEAFYKLAPRPFMHNPPFNREINIYLWEMQGAQITEGLKKGWSVE